MGRSDHCPPDCQWPATPPLLSASVRAVVGLPDHHRLIAPHARARVSLAPPVISQICRGRERPPGARRACRVRRAALNPLKTTASSRRASTLAARRNKVSTLVISGSAICAPRTRTLTCRVASCQIVPSSIAYPVREEVGAAARALLGIPICVPAARSRCPRAAVRSTAGRLLPLVRGSLPLE